MSRRQEPSGTGIIYMITQPMETPSVTQSGCLSLHYCHPFPKQQQLERSMTTTQHRAPASALSQGPWQTWALAAPQSQPWLPEAAVDGKKLQSRVNAKGLF